MRKLNKMKKKMKIISLLVYPFENVFLIKITRATGFFDFPQKTTNYSVPLDSPLVDSFIYWLGILHALNQKRMIVSLRDNFYKKAAKLNG